MVVSRSRTDFVHLSEVWEAEAERWIQWVRTPGHDSYWQFHRDQFLRLLPPLSFSRSEAAILVGALKEILS